MRPSIAVRCVCLSSQCALWELFPTAVSSQCWIECASRLWLLKVSGNYVQTNPASGRDTIVTSVGCKSGTWVHTYRTYFGSWICCSKSCGSGFVCDLRRYCTQLFDRFAAWFEYHTCAAYAVKVGCSAVAYSMLSFFARSTMYFAVFNVIHANNKTKFGSVVNSATTVIAGKNQPVVSAVISPLTKL